MSERSELAQRIVAFCGENDLDQPYGGDFQQDSKRRGKPYIVLFCRPGNLDGVVMVYGEKFLQVKYSTRYQELPHQDNRVFESEEHLLDFLKKAFVDFDCEAALAIPTKHKLEE